VAAALIHADLTELIGAFRVYANAPKNRVRLLGRRAHALMSMPDKQLVLLKSHTNWPRTLEASGHWPDEKKSPPCIEPQSWRFYKVPAPDPIWKQTNPVHILV